ncbi:hypothetical protein BH18ACI5_BH18ACI5_26650 [soil metagenome]
MRRPYALSATWWSIVCLVAAPSSAGAQVASPSSWQAAAFVVTSVAATRSQEPTDVVAWVEPDTLAIKSTVLAPDGCYSGGAAVGGAPAGSLTVQNAVSITLPLNRADGMCTQALTPVSFSITVRAPRGAQAVIIYTTNSFTKTVSVRALAIPPTSPSPIGGARGTQPPPPSLQGTAWTLTHLGGEPVTVQDPQTAPSLTLQVNALRLSGSGGCNRIMGTYELNGQSLRFGPVVGTRMSCLNGMDTEVAFIAALAQIKSWRIAGSVLQLMDAGGRPVARFDARDGMSARR